VSDWLVTSRRINRITPDVESLEPERLARALCRLGHVRQLQDLGRGGPLDASAGRKSAFGCLFGRDSLRMALDLVDDFPAVARVTIRRLTALQGVRESARAEEEPGRILHEYRYLPEAGTASIVHPWDMPYYGSVDATPLYVNLIDAYCQQFGQAILSERVRDRTRRLISIRTGMERALGWIEGRLAEHGYVYVRRAQPRGLGNQVWEDSFDSQYDESGRLFDPDVAYAPVEVQGYAYDALLAGAALAENPTRVRHLRALASMLRRKVLSEFWLTDLGTFAPALVLEPSGTRPSRVVASSPGHLLASKLLDGEDAAAQRSALVARLLAADMLTPAGIRTKSTGSPRFNAGSYHNGSVWPMDTGVIADGMRRHGYTAEADDLDDRVLRACASVGDFVEFFRGDTDAIAINDRIRDVEEAGALRRLEQPPQRTQGWTVSRVWRVLRRRDLVPTSYMPAAA
jgi:glycogen debranching enzyme